MLTGYIFNHQCEKFPIFPVIPLSLHILELIIILRLNLCVKYKFLFVIQVWVKLWCHASKGLSKTWLCFTSGSSKRRRRTSTRAASWFSTTAPSRLQPSSSLAKTMPCVTWPSWRSALNTGGRGACLWRAGSGKSPSMRRT